MKRKCRLMSWISLLGLVGLVGCKPTPSAAPSFDKGFFVAPGGLKSNAITLIDYSKRTSKYVVDETDTALIPDGVEPQGSVALAFRQFVDGYSIETPNPAKVTDANGNLVDDLRGQGLSQNQFTQIESFTPRDDILFVHVAGPDPAPAMTVSYRPSYAWILGPFDLILDNPPPALAILPPPSGFSGISYVHVLSTHADGSPTIKNLDGVGIASAKNLSGEPIQVSATDTRQVAASFIIKQCPGGICFPSSVTIAGSDLFSTTNPFLSTLNCPAWTPACNNARLTRDSNGIWSYNLATTAFTANDLFEFKVIVNPFENDVNLGNQWFENYGSGGFRDGQNVCYRVTAADISANNMILTYNEKTHGIYIASATFPAGLNYIGFTNCEN